MKIMVAGTNQTVEVEEAIDGQLTDENGTVYKELHDVGGTKFFQAIEDQVEHVVATVENEVEKVEAEVETETDKLEEKVAENDGLSVEPEASAPAEDGVADAPDDAPESIDPGDTEPTDPEPQVAA